jgi:hypothetical protein
MMGPEEQREFRLGWSVFRRAHQAVAKRSHKASRINKHATDHHANNEYDAGRRGGDPDPHRAGGAAGAPTALTRAPKAGLLWPTNSGSALERYYRRRSRARDAPDAMIGKCSARYCG